MASNMIITFSLKLSLIISRFTIDLVQTILAVSFLNDSSSNSYIDINIFACSSVTESACFFL